MKTYIVKVKVSVENDVDKNDAIGGLCDIVRDGLNKKEYNYLKDIVIVREK